MARRHTLNLADPAAYEAAGQRDAAQGRPFLRSGETILDFGGGIGRVAKPLAEAGFRVILADPSPDMLRFAGDYLARVAVARVLFTPPRLPLADGAVDFCCGFFVLEHLPKALVYLSLRELRRVTRRGGWFCLPRLQESTWGKFLWEVGAWERGEDLSTALRFYDPVEIELLAGKAGWRVDLRERLDSWEVHLR